MRYLIFIDCYLTNEVLHSQQAVGISLKYAPMTGEYDGTVRLMVINDDDLVTVPSVATAYHIVTYCHTDDLTHTHCPHLKLVHLHSYICTTCSSWLLYQKMS